MDTEIPRRVKVFLTLGLLIVGVTVIAAVVVESQMEDPKLTALKAERFAAFTPPGGRLVSSFESGEGSFLGKAWDAEVHRVFAHSSREQARNAWRAALRYARTDGWRMSSPTPTSTGALVSGDKTLPSGEVMLTAGWYRDEGQDKVSIQLEHVPCPDVVCR